MFPLPSLSVPSQTADPVRVAIVLISFVVDQLRFAPDVDTRNPLFSHSIIKDCHVERSETSLGVAVPEIGQK
jgi:hypothetical protein